MHIFKNSIKIVNVIKLSQIRPILLALKLGHLKINYGGMLIKAEVLKMVKNNKTRVHKQFKRNKT